MKNLNKFIVWLLRGLIHAYRLTFSSFMGRACRFQRTGSAYALEARVMHGPWRGGVVGIRDPDYGTVLRTPSSPLLEEFLALYIRFRTHAGTSPTYARHQRAVLREAGFVRSEGSASAVSWGTSSALQQSKLAWEERCRQPAFVDTVLGQEWVDETRWNALVAEVLAWCDRQDAFSFAVYCEAIGWVDDSRG